MAKVLFASDIHAAKKKHVQHWSVFLNERLADMNGDDAFVILGDVADSLELFNEVLEAFSWFAGTKIICPGNHDLYKKGNLGSIELLDGVLPYVSRDKGYHWFDDKDFFLVGGRALVVNPCWTDLSFDTGSFGKGMIFDAYDRGIMDARLITVNPGELHDRFMSRFETQCAAAAASGLPVVFGSHWPIYRESYEPFPFPLSGKPKADALDAYFYSPKFGDVALAEVKQDVSFVSGHLHLSGDGADERATWRFVPADYGKPACVLYDCSDGTSEAFKR